MVKFSKNQLQQMNRRPELSDVPRSLPTINSTQGCDDSYYCSSYDSPSWFHSGHSQAHGLSQGRYGHNSTGNKGITTMNYPRRDYSPPINTSRHPPLRNSSKYPPPRSRKYPPPRNLKESFVKRDSSVGCERQIYGHISNLKNGKLIVSQAQESECNTMIGVCPVKEKATVDFAHQMYPIPRSLKGFPLIGCQDQKFNDSGKLTVVDDQMKSRENECYVSGASNPPNEKLMVVNDKMKSERRESNVIGKNPLKDNVGVDYAPGKYPPPRILKGFSLKRDFPVGCKTEKFSHCGKLMVDNNQIESRGSECNMIGVKPLKENVRVDFAPRKYPPRILKGFSLKRDFSNGCGNEKFSHCGKLMVDNNQIESGGSESNMISDSNLSNGNLGVAYDKMKFGESECTIGLSNLSNLNLVVAHDESKSDESGSKIVGVNPLKENARRDLASRKYPPPKILGFSLRRDFPSGFKRQKVDDSPNEILKEDIQPLEVIDHETKSRDMLMEEIEPSQGSDPEIKSREPFKAINHGSKSRESERDMTCVDPLKKNVRVGCVKRKLPLTKERSMVEIKPKQVSDKIDLNIRNKMKNALQSFQDMVNHLMLEGANARVKILIQAAKALKEQSKWIYTSKRIGPIPGVKVGDMFQWFAEMNVIGLHNQFFSGIDYTKIHGKVIATSVVASGRYSNNENCSGDLVYSGQGENPTVNQKKQLEDQKLERGNLALKNSMEERRPVRVIRSLKLSKPLTYIGMSGRRIFDKVYIYDGLYLVDRYWQERGKFGKLVFMFWLKRLEGQPKCTFWERSEIENSKLKKG